jgi:hypothetical protein
VTTSLETDSHPAFSSKKKKKKNEKKKRKKKGGKENDSMTSLMKTMHWEHLFFSPYSPAHQGNNGFCTVQNVPPFYDLG